MLTEARRSFMAASADRAIADGALPCPYCMYDDPWPNPACGDCGGTGYIYDDEDEYASDGRL